MCPTLPATLSLDNGFALTPSFHRPHSLQRMNVNESTGSSAPAAKEPTKPHVRFASGEVATVLPPFFHAPSSVRSPDSDHVLGPPTVCFVVVKFVLMMLIKVDRTGTTATTTALGIHSKEPALSLLARDTELFANDGGRRFPCCCSHPAATSQEESQDLG